MRYRRLVTAALLASASAPALAQESPIELFARVAGGLVDGGQVSMGSLGVGGVARVAGNAFEIRFAAGEPAIMTFDQPLDCIFLQGISMKGQPSTTIRLDFNRITSIQLLDQGKFNELNAVALQFEGPEGIAQLVSVDGGAQNIAPLASIVTSLSLDDIAAAASALRKVCPGPTS
jgi:hypothetical protein